MKIFTVYYLMISLDTISLIPYFIYVASDGKYGWNYPIWLCLVIGVLVGMITALWESKIFKK